MILVTGATGFLGKRVCRLLDERSLPYRKTSLSLGLDLRDREAIESFFEHHRPSQVLNCAAFVGGIQFGYKYPAELFQNNLLLTTNLLHASAKYGVKRVVNPISNCAYPGEASVFREDEFWDGPLHESVLVYGFVRKASWVGSWAYARQHGLDVLNLVLSNMYGPEDHFEAERSHALGALIMKITEAKLRQLPSVDVWGSGKPVREWLHVDDGAEALVRGMDVPPTTDILNIGIGKGISIAELAALIKRLVGYDGALLFDSEKPDGAPFKTVNGDKGEAHFGWRPSRPLEDGIKEAIQFYLSMRDSK
jgi:GDP-L-fucose synthase